MYTLSCKASYRVQKFLEIPKSHPKVSPVLQSIFLIEPVKYKIIFLFIRVYCSIANVSERSYLLFNRPGVAGAVLQTPLPLIN